ncbi:MAG TPA: penicillin-binding protein 2 [Rhodocyclaceae bacterium]|nr:penicillin-binding protein 2 [Rhodocyclaceae bacterium]HMV19651.1 penicillin-binding protein 2 [Rhodocyclaceae bacterium]HMW76361.1 penicillin-binding protein 2 [Rhodocyclaceae bacterium]HNE43521.1 penicillin-binding protein 2 [Rhodocyclaceae bacterium]HNM20888.1 penicillin-binding protein 2 [Rhodocyclaceae bacterium]
MADFHNPDGDLERFRLRVGIAGLAVLIAFCILFGRFVYLQIVQHEYYRTRAEDNRIALLPIVPNRGVITDRNGIVLARNYSAFTLEITPSRVAVLDQTIDGLAEIIEIQSKDRKRFKRLLDEAKNFESIPIRTRLSDEEVARFAAHRYRFPGVEVKARLFRQYPLGTVASHALGYMGRVTDRDLEWIGERGQEANYKGTDHVGKTGLEQHYEFELHGETGYEQVEIDAGGRAIRSLRRTPPVSGNNLALTLDAKLQEMAEKAFGDRKGSLVAIEPATGGVLALVSSPTFDPNLFVDGITPENWKDLNDDPKKPMVNRAINGAYPPGSTFKPFMALAALEAGKRTPAQVINDPGFFTFGNHTFRDDKKGGHGAVDMYKSIVHSCDTYYYMLANDLGIDGIARFMGSIGLGQRTGVDLGKDDSGESKGVLPSPEWKRQRFKRPEQQKWYAGETISIGIGQGYNAYTPIQLAQATATVANNGVMFRPHLVSHITDARTGARRPIEPQPIRTLDWKPQNIETIKRALVGVNKEGTGARAFAGASYEAAGKTGTAQVFSLKGAQYREGGVKKELRDHALFIAFAPVENPRIALAILVENGGFGAQSAAPIARMVFDYYLLGKVPAGAAGEDAAAVENDNDEE